MYSGIRSARKLYEKKDFKFKSEILQFAIANQQEANKRKTVLLFANLYTNFTKLSNKNTWIHVSQYLAIIRNAMHILLPVD
jgi:hypothetical protein